MSYDLLLFHPVAGEDPAATVESTGEDPSLSSTARAQYRAVVEALRRAGGLELHEGENYLQLVSPEGGDGVSIEFYERSAALSIPYWHAESAPRVLARVSEYLRVIQRETGFQAFDPQTERVVDLEVGLANAGPTYAVGVDVLRTDACKKPWWKLW